MIICGIDPGTHATGYGILDFQKRAGSTLRYVTHGTIRPKAEALPLRLKEIFLKVTSVLEEFSPAEVAVETTFHALNAQSALKLGQARGVIILAASLLDIPVFEYTPTEVKKAACGYGRAGKDQVSDMVMTILHLPKGAVSSSDASDALAIGLCHSSSRRLKELLQ